MKKLFIAVMALATIVSCSKENEEANVTPVGSETALLSVSLKAVGTRAAYDYAQGNTDENAVKSIDFYLFDAKGDYYPAAGSSNKVSVASDALSKWTDGSGNIDQKSEIYLVIAKKQDTPPAQIVAVINSTADYTKKTLSQLQAEVVALSTENGFVMTNSVYEGDNGVVVATPIFTKNIFTTSEPKGQPGTVYPAEGETKDTNVVPVEIYVERVAAKVQVSAGTNVLNEKKLIPVKNDNGENMPNTFVQVLGWQVTNATTSSYLLKKYGEGNFFTALNDKAAFRSHWAETYGQTVQHNLTFNAITGEDALNLGDHNYYLENTLSSENTDGWFNDVKTNTHAQATKAAQLIVAAQLVDANGSPKEFGIWYGKQYDQLEDTEVDGKPVYGLKSLMINNAAKQIFVKDKENSTADKTVYRSITAADEDVTFYQVDDQTSYKATGWNGDLRYEVKVKAKEDVQYYSAEKDANGNPIALEADAVNAILEKIEPAMMWKSGYTYYSTLINHYNVGETQLNGLVRNHVYDIKITSVNGYGTPVYDPKMIITPEIPVDQKGFSLTAQINVLSWAVVSQDVNLGN